MELCREGDFGKCSSSLTRWPQCKGTTGLECVLGDGCSQQKVSQNLTVRNTETSVFPEPQGNPPQFPLQAHYRPTLD